MKLSNLNKKFDITATLNLSNTDINRFFSTTAVYIAHKYALMVAFRKVLKRLENNNSVKFGQYTEQAIDALNIYCCGDHTIEDELKVFIDTDNKIIDVYIDADFIKEYNLDENKQDVYDMFKEELRTVRVTKKLLVEAVKFLESNLGGDYSNCINYRLPK